MRRRTVERFADIGITVELPTPSHKATPGDSATNPGSPATAFSAEALWDAVVAEMGTVKVPSYARPVIILASPTEAREAFRAMYDAIDGPPETPPPARFTVRRDFDCGSYINAWSLFVVRPNGQHISHLQFSLSDEAKAQAIADTMNQALDIALATLPPSQAPSKPATVASAGEAPQPASTKWPPPTPENAAAWAADAQGGA